MIPYHDDNKTQRTALVTMGLIGLNLASHEGKQRRDQREQAAWQGQALDASDKVLRTAGRDAVAVLAEQSQMSVNALRRRPPHPGSPSA